MDPKLAEDMKANAQSAVELAKTRFQVALDYRPESVQELEKLFDRVRYAMPDPESKETLGHVEFGTIGLANPASKSPVQQIPIFALLSFQSVLDPAAFIRAASRVRFASSTSWWWRQ